MAVKCEIVGEYVQLSELENKYLSDGDSLLVTYSCRIEASKKKLVGIDVVLTDDADHPGKQDVVFEETWPCERSPQRPDVIHVQTYRRITIAFANALRFRPDLINRGYFPHRVATIRVWIAYASRVERMRYLNSDVLGAALVWRKVKAKIRPPFSRPSILSTVCLGFGSTILYQNELKTIYQCPLEHGS